MLEVGGALLRPGGEMARDVLLHEEASDGHTVLGAEAAVLYIDGDGYLRIVHRGETHEDGVVRTTVLGRTGLSANGERQGGEGVAGAAKDGGAHALHYPVVGFAGCHSVVLGLEEGVEWFALHLLHYMGHAVIAAIGDGGAEVGYLQGGEVDLALSDGDGDDGEAVPRPFIVLVVVVAVGDEASLLAWQVDAGLVAEAHGDHVVTPAVHGIDGLAVFLAVAYHIVEAPAEVAVARGGDGGHEGEGRAVAVTAYVEALEGEAVGAVELCLGGDDALGEVGQRLCGLEGGAWGILSHDGAVEEGLPRVLLQGEVVLAALAACHDAGVVGGRRYHAEYLAGGGLDGYDAAYLAFHESLAECLQLEVDGEGEILACYGATVVGSVAIASLDAAVGIAQEYLHALLATELLLVIALHTEFADIVALLVVVVLLDVLLGDLGDIAQHMGGIGVLILTDGASLDVEAGEAEEFLTEDGEVLLVELGHEDLLGVARIAGVLVAVLDVGHSLDEVFLGDAEGIADVEGVDMVACLIHHDHDVEGRLVIDEEFAVAVVDGAS